MSNRRSDLSVLIMHETKTDIGLDGVGRYVLYLCKTLQLQGIRTVVLYNRRDEFFSLLEGEGHDVRYLPFPRAHPSIRYHPRERRRVQRMKNEVHHIVQDEGISIIHLQQAYLLDFVDRAWGRPIYCPQLAGSPDPKPLRVFAPSLLLHPRRLAQAWYRKHVMYNFDRADLVVSLTEVAIETSVIAYGIQKSKNVIVTQGVPPASPSADARKFRAELGISDDVRLVISVGRITRDKGVEDFGEIARRVHRADGKLKFCFIGYYRDRSYYARVLDRYGAWVDFPGPREDVHNIYAAADLMLSLSHREASPYVVVEAMAYGVPSVAWDTTGAGTRVRDGENGLLAPFGDLEAASAAVRSCLEDRALYSRLSEGARRRSTDFSMEKYADDMIAVYDRLLSAQRQPVSPSRPAL